MKSHALFCAGAVLAVLHDPGGSLAGSLGSTKFPETLLIDSKGEVLYKWVGPQDWLSAEVLDTFKRFIP